MGSFTLENIFLIMFVTGFLFALMSAIMSGAFESEFGEGSSFEGGDVDALGGDVGPTAHEGMAEVGWSQLPLATFSPLSPTVLSSFVTAVGGIGYVCLKAFEFGPWTSGLLAVVFGFVFAAIVFAGFSWVFNATQGSSVGDLSSMAGREAEVVEPIPSQGSGRVAFLLSGQRETASARTADMAEVPQGARVIVKQVSTEFLTVEETRESWLARKQSDTPGRRV